MVYAATITHLHRKKRIPPAAESSHGPHNNTSAAGPSTTRRGTSVHRRYRVFLAVFVVTLLVGLCYVARQKLPLNHLEVVATRNRKTPRAVTEERRSRYSSHSSVECSEDDPFRLCSFLITDGQHVSSPPPPSNHSAACSCWDISDPPPAKRRRRKQPLKPSQCCDRILHGNHKMGHELSRQYFGEGGTYHWNEENPELDGMVFGEIVPNLTRYFSLFERGRDYREIFMVRNWFDSLISGYLYHKTGRECHLNRDGKPRKLVPQQETGPNVYPQYITHAAPYPPLRERFICTYLAEESEYNGMRVYSEWAVRRYYFNNLLMYRAMQEREDPYHRRTMFVCYERLNDPSTADDTIRQIKQWFYPAVNDFADSLPPSRRSYYNGSHASDRDPAVRRRLYNILLRLDAEAFGGAIGHHSELFGCISEMEKP